MKRVPSAHVHAISRLIGARRIHCAVISQQRIRGRESVHVTIIGRCFILAHANGDAISRGTITRLSVDLQVIGRAANETKLLLAVRMTLPRADEHAAIGVELVLYASRHTRLTRETRGEDDVFARSQLSAERRAQIGVIRQRFRNLGVRERLCRSLLIAQKQGLTVNALHVQIKITVTSLFRRTDDPHLRRSVEVQALKLRPALLKRNRSLLAVLIAQTQAHPPTDGKIHLKPHVFARLLIAARDATQQVLLLSNAIQNFPNTLAPRARRPRRHRRRRLGIPTHRLRATEHRARHPTRNHHRRSRPRASTSSVRTTLSSSGAHRHHRSVTLNDDIIFPLTTHRRHHRVVVTRRRRLVETIVTIHLSRAGRVLRPPASSVDARLCGRVLRERSVSVPKHISNTGQ